MQWDLKSPEEKHGVSTKHCIILSHWVNTTFPLLHLFTLGRHELKNLFGTGQIMQVSIHSLLEKSFVKSCRSN